MYILVWSAKLHHLPLSSKYLTFFFARPCLSYLKNRSAAFGDILQGGTLVLVCYEKI